MRFVLIRVYWPKGFNDGLGQKISVFCWNHIWYVSWNSWVPGPANSICYSLLHYLLVYLKPTLWVSRARPSRGCRGLFDAQRKILATFLGISRLKRRSSKMRHQQLLSDLISGSFGHHQQQALAWYLRRRKSWGFSELGNAWCEINQLDQKHGWNNLDQ